MDTNPQIKKISLGFLLLVLGIFLVSTRFGPHTESGLHTFAEEPIKVQSFSRPESYARIPTRVLIPTLSIDLEVRESNEVNGYWEVFEDKAGWGEGSGVPGEIGNQVVFAHARENLFKPLVNAKIGNDIYILAQENSDLENKNTWFRYKIEEIKEVYPNQTEVIAPSDDERLTLYTCSGFGDKKRLIILAKRIVS